MESILDISYQNRLSYFVDMTFRSKTSERGSVGSGVNAWTTSLVTSLTLFLALLLPMVAGACDVPVFRYALDNWPADAYEAVVVHQGGDEAEASLAILRDQAVTTANLVVREVNPDQIPPSFSQLLQEQPAASMPWPILRFPVRQETRRTALAGPLNRETASACLDSPCRQELIRLLLEGRTSVWILLESGTRSKVKRAHAVLVDELARLERTLRFPTDFTSMDKLGPSFSILRLSPDNPRETELIAMLRGSEPDLEQRTDEPIVFPVFGRGIILYALIGDGINTTTIAEAAEFITGSCSCEVKSQNPGIELLLSADWGVARMGGIADFASRAAQAETLMATADTAEVAPIQGMVADIRADRGMPATDSVPPETPQHPSVAQRMLRVVLWLVVAGVAALTILRLAHRRRRSDT